MVNAYLYVESPTPLLHGKCFILKAAKMKQSYGELVRQVAAEPGAVFKAGRPEIVI